MFNMVKKLGRRVIGKYNGLPVMAKATFWFFLCNVIQKGLSVLTVPIITRMLNTYEYGMYSVFCSYSDILVIFCTLRLFGNGYFVGLKHFEDNKSRYTSSIAGLMIFLTTIVLSLYLAFRDKMLQLTALDLQKWLVMFIWVYCQGAIGLWYAQNRSEFKYKAIVAGTLFIAIITPVLKVALITILGNAGKDKSLGAILGLVLPNIVVAIVAWFSTFSSGKCLISKDCWTFALRFNIPLIPFYLSQTILNQADRIMIERMDSPSSAGIYSVAYSLAMVISVVNNAIETSFVPWQFKKMETGEQRKIAGVLNVIMLFVLGVHLAVIAIAPEIMRVFAAKEYAEAIYVIPPVTIGILMQFIAQIFINVEFFYEQNRLAAVSSIFSAIANVVLNLIAIPKFGYLAAGYTTLICYFANLVFHGIMAYHLVKEKRAEMPVDIKRTAIFVAVSLALMFLLIFTYGHDLLRWLLLFAFVIAFIVNRKKLFNNAQAVLKEVKNG